MPLQKMSVAFAVTVALVNVCLMPVASGQVNWPGATWDKTMPAEVGMDGTVLKEARDYALTGQGSGYITRHGKLVMSWGDVRKQYDLKSTSKSIGVTALGLAIGDGKIKLDDVARRYHPSLGTPPEENVSTGWLDEITILHLATQTAGFAKRGGYERLLFRPGTKWLYSDGGPNWLAECVTMAYGVDIETLMFDRVLTPIGVKKSDLRWRKNQYRPHQINGVMRREFGSGVHANVDAMARLGYLYLRQGTWNTKQLIPKDFIRMASTTLTSVTGLPEHAKDPRDVRPGTSASYGNASDHYGLLWWNNADRTLKKVPQDAYWSWGLYDSLIVVIPSLDVVASRAGRSWKRDPEADHYDVLRPFLERIVVSVNDARSALSEPPYPASPVIRRVDWDPLASITRKAEGSDNWPLTWADDGHLYTAYGDGWGFKPLVDKKLSMGFAKIVGGPHDFRGINIRSSSGETLGQGPHGKKASGILMVDRMLYLWARNASNSQLAWSDDHGKSWTWCDWKFTTSFGCPTFLNFGKNYAGARDDYVYIYSLDSDTAYRPADRMVLARVATGRIKERDAYQFVQALDKKGQPQWTTDIHQRGAVFTHSGRCYRSGISYNDGLNRYLWCQIHPESNDSRGPRFQGGFGIYDAPEPWGPWTTAFFASTWDVGPGETSCLPTKWMSTDGKTVHLVFSGDDFFSVRKATLVTANRKQ